LSGLDQAALDLTTRCLGYVLDVDPGTLRADSPLRDVGADSVALIVFGDVAEAFAASAGLSAFNIDNGALRLSTCVGDLADSLSWDKT